MGSSSKLQPMSDSSALRVNFSNGVDSAPSPEEIDEIMVCAKCYQEISGQARVCPHCGAMIPTL